jgi:hypothetical protein
MPIEGSLENNWVPPSSARLGVRSVVCNHIDYVGKKLSSSCSLATGPQRHYTPRLGLSSRAEVSQVRREASLECHARRIILRVGRSLEASRLVGPATDSVASNYAQYIVHSVMAEMGTGF